MANVGTAAPGKTLIGAGIGSSPTYADIGTNSGLTAHGVVVSEGLGAFQSVSPGTTGLVFTSNGPSSNPSFQTATLTPGTNALIGTLQYFSISGGDSYVTSANWLKCNGQIVSQATYPTLYSRVGLINGPGASFWTSANPGTSSVLVGVAAGPTGYSIVSTAANTGFFTTDLKTWSAVFFPNSLQMTSLVYGSALYVTGSTSGIIQTSTDGISWNTKTPSIGTTPNSLTFNNSLFVGAGSNAGIIVTSTDATTWTGRNSGMSGGTITALNYGNGLYLIGSFGGLLNTSTNGISWTAQSSGTDAEINTFIYGTKYVYGAATGNLATSDNAVTWTLRTSGTASAITSLGYGNSLYLYGGAGGVLASSLDAITWTARTSQTTSMLNTITYGTVYVYGANGGRIASSTDGITWTNRTSNTASIINALVYGNSLYVYCTNGGGIGTSVDATTWTARTSNTATSLYGLAYDGVLWHAAGANISLTSTDAITWTPITQSLTASNINTVTFGNGLYLYGTTGGGLGTSTDGQTWTARTSNTSSSILTLIYGNAYVYGTFNGGIGSSTDATTWTARTSGVVNSINSLAYGVNNYIGSVPLGDVLTSTDATTWSLVRVPNIPTTGLGNLGAGGSVYISTAGFTSTNGTTWAASDMITLLTSIATGTYFVAVGSAGRIQTAPVTYTYNSASQFQLPTETSLNVSLISLPTSFITETSGNFLRALYIKAL